MIQYIIVDDEVAAHTIIEDYASNLKDLSLQKHCYNAFEAIDFLDKNEVDLIFLDINMPKLTGFEMLRTRKNPPKVIVTTAYKEFALEGYELNVIDYLLKPFGFQRFMEAIEKVKDAISKEKNSPDLSEQRIFLKDNKKHHQVKLSEILYVEACGNYIKVYVENQLFMNHQTLTSFEKSLPENQFLKVHKSFIVAIDKIETIEGNQICIGSHKIPIGKVFKSKVNELLG